MSALAQLANNIVKRCAKSHLVPPLFGTMARDTFRDLAQLEMKLWRNSPYLLRRGRDQYLRSAPSRAGRAP
ncbi:hypothetical protein EVAR_10541_1 [Eumeta japonica]|uniref:Uncharacterized protein n=1 Tax=Eumeta variegata TaxID=151549 RepID=A0A4C1TIH1_EUMVA|nr:hypothetical protein EVAR_10541_1 [Eumeta japonica]